MDAVLLGILIVGGTAAFAGAGVLAGRRAIRNHVAAFHNEVMVSLFAAAGVVYAVLLGFLVVVVWEQYDDAHRNVAEEASTLVPLYRLTYGMRADEGAELRVVIRRYADAVITDEWLAMGTDAAGNVLARRAIGDMDRLFARMDTSEAAADAQVMGEFLRTKSRLVEDRNERLMEASDATPWIIWLGSIGGGVIVLVMSFFIYMERAWPHVLMTSLMGALIGLLLYAMAILSTPFAGPLALGPEHFRTAVQVMNDEDRGN